MKKHTMLNLDDRLVDAMRGIAKLMGMSLSEWISYISRDKIDYFLRHKENYLLPPSGESKEAQRNRIAWEKDIKKVVEIIKDLWKH